MFQLLFCWRWILRVWIPYWSLRYMVKMEIFASCCSHVTCIPLLKKFYFFCLPCHWLLRTARVQEWSFASGAISARGSGREKSCNVLHNATQLKIQHTTDISISQFFGNRGTFGCSSVENIFSTSHVLEVQLKLHFQFAVVKANQQIFLTAFV